MSKKKRKSRKKKSIREMLVLPEEDWEEEVEFTDVDDLSEALVTSCLSLDSKRKPEEYIV